MKKENFFEKNINPTLMFLLELFILPCFIFLNHIYIRLFLVLLYFGFSILNGKKIKYFYFITIFISIVFFSLMNLNGQIIFSFSFIKITKDSLVYGINHGLLILGFVFVSLSCVQKNLYIPSKIGYLISKMFSYYQIILDTKKNKVKSKTFIKDIDSFLKEVYNLGLSIKDDGKEIKKTSKFGYLFILFVLLLHIAFVLLYVFYLRDNKDITNFD